jgi:hypothetical protein
VERVNDHVCSAIKIPRARRDNYLGRNRNAGFTREKALATGWSPPGSPGLLGLPTSYETIRHDRDVLW